MPGVLAEEAARERRLRQICGRMFRLRVGIAPCIGEGGPGGALGNRVADPCYVLSTVSHRGQPPEACARFLWRDAIQERRQRRRHLTITAADTASARGRAIWVPA